METIRNVISVIGMLAIITAIIIGWLPPDPPKRKNKIVPGIRLHCFECEIDMPVKEKNGQMYCANCGLRH